MKSILIIGSGIVGICTGIELIKRGYTVTLMDPNKPGSQTSYGNAGVITDASLMIINNPQLLKSLFSLIFKKNTAFRYSILFVLARLSWIISFLMFSSKKHMEKSARALRELQVLSLNCHKKLIKSTNSERNITTPGWLKLFKTKKGFDKYLTEINLLNKNKVEYDVLETNEVSKKYPDLKEIFYKGVLFINSLRVKSPQKLSENYFNYFKNINGNFINESCQNLKFTGNKWRVYSNKSKYNFEQIIISTGPWSKKILSELGYNIPLAWEKGYHHHFSTKKNIAINPAIHDVEGGFVYSSNGGEVRITSGVELNFFNNKKNTDQIKEAIFRLKKIIPLKKQLTKEAWLGSRPTIVDSMPMIGKAPKHEKLWFNFGHNHIGLSTSAGSAKVLGEMIEGKKVSINVDPFLPSRFKL